MKNPVITIIIATLSIANAFAESDSQSPIDAFRSESQYQMLACSTMLKIALKKAEIGEDSGESGNYRKCIADGKKSLRAHLDAAIKITRKPKTQQALKDFYVASSSAIDGINPGLQERKISYEQRQQAMNDKLNEAWARIEVER